MMRRPLALVAGCMLDTTSLQPTGTERRIQAILAAPAAVNAVSAVSATEEEVS
jgi:hypothetical protein